MQEEKAAPSRCGGGRSKGIPVPCMLIALLSAAVMLCLAYYASISGVESLIIASSTSVGGSSARAMAAGLMAFGGQPNNGRRKPDAGSVAGPEGHAGATGSGLTRVRRDGQLGEKTARRKEEWAGQRQLGPRARDRKEMGKVASAYWAKLESQGLDEYQAMLDEYSATTAQRRGVPTVAYVCATKRCAGLADRLLGMTCIFNLAVMEDMPFKIGPQPGGGWELEPAAVPWAFDFDDQRRECSEMLQWNYWYPLDKVVAEWRQFARSGKNATFCVQVNQVFDPRWVGTNRSGIISRSRAAVMHTLNRQRRGSFEGMEAMAVGTLSHLFKFSSKVTEDMDALKAALEYDKFESVVAVHIRDMITEYRLGIDSGMTSREYMDIAVECSLRMERELGLSSDTAKTGWLIFTDRLIDFPNVTRQKYGHKIMAIYDARRKGVVKPGNTARSRGPDRAKANFMALRDTALMTEGKVRAIGRTDGGFARLASLFGAKPVFECGLPRGYTQSNLVVGDQRKQLKLFNFTAQASKAR